MTGLTRRCPDPDPEAIAAFVMGNLSGAELKTMADHLRECEDCREIAAEAARIDREGVPLVALADRAGERQRPRTWPWWLGVAAAALIGLFFLSSWPILSRRSGGAIQTLVDAVPRDGRSLEPRLTGGFPWAPLRATRRGNDEPLDAGQMKLVGAAGRVIEQTGNDDSLQARHAAALAHLLAGRPKEAADRMASIAKSASDAKLWSDLAASRYAEAVQLDDPTELAEGLAAADAALRLAPDLPEALFNRALTLERLGLRDLARAAWEKYLAVDGSSPWANEARRHVKTLVPLTDFGAELQRQYALLGRDPRVAHALAEQFPQEARVWGETEILARWAEAVKGGDVDAAGMHLGIARAFAEELAGHGDAMLTRAVAAIEAADAGQRLLLADAHLVFRTAQRTYKSNKPAAAEPLFTQAAAGFDRGGSPIALVARYFAANTIYDQGRIPEAHARLTELARSAPPEFPAHRAQLEWQIGLTQAAAGRWGSAIGALSDSVTAFERLRETRHANAVRDILAEVYDRIGDRRAAWAHRIAALRELGRSDASRLQVALDAAARAAAVNRDWDTSVSLLGLQIETLRAGGDELLYVEALLQRACMYARLGAAAAATSDLGVASQAMGRLHDAAIYERVEADRLTVEAFLASAPADALPLLTRAIEFHRVKGRRMHLPELLLQRGKAYVATGNVRAAADDFEAGIREVEAQGTSMSANEQGTATFVVAGELFDEAIALAASRNDTVGAFAYSERARTRDDTASGTMSGSAVAIDGTIVVEYASLPNSLVIFVANGGRVRMFFRPVGRAVLAAEAERLTVDAMSPEGAHFSADAAALYERLIAPIGAEIEGVQTVVFVADATLSTVPFSALIDGDGRYLVEKHAVVMAPSRAMFIRLAAGRRSPPATLRLLLVTGPSSRYGDLGSISSAQGEAEAIAAAYGSAVLAPEGRDGDGFEARAANADVIHFVGHAVMPDGKSEAALLTSRDGGAGRLEAQEIAAMQFPRTRAVVLAACGTARGRERPGETSISVARAFLAAGVPSVVATLWPIEDGPAADFFPRFHRYLIRGSSPAQALRAVQLEWIHRPNTPPGMWAAVQLIGS